MDPTDRLSLLSTRERDGEHWVDIQDASSGRKGFIPGALLEAQFVGEGGVFLVFTTQDSPFEEQLDIIMLDEALDVLDRATLAAAYATGTLRALDAEKEGVSFSFFGEDRWRVACRPSPAWRLPWVAAPGLHRSPRFRSRLTIERLRP